MLDDWMETTDRVGDIIDRVSRSADVTIEQVRSSEDAHEEYEKVMESHRARLDVHCAGTDRREGNAKESTQEHGKLH